LYGCDAVQPTEDPVLVVEAFLDAGKPLPRVRLGQTTPLSQPYQGTGTAVSDAEVRLSLGGREVVYRPVLGQPGVYEPAAPSGELVPPRVPFTIDVRWGAQHATASGVTPPLIRIVDVSVSVTDEPIKAVQLDSLVLDPARLDTLRLDSTITAAGLTYIYPVAVTVKWQVDFNEMGADSVYWVRTQLKPPASVTSDRINFFLRPEQIQPERKVARDSSGRKRWTGIYAVPVASEDAPLPPHRLRVALLRSNGDYARYASSRDAPERREPISNVEGAIGIVSGISVDSLIVEVGPNTVASLP
ncbi:MAG TPA: DUF4249 family protein, partial [Rhodothermales bacterium]|nr:DUF4249 family protein [Rhodothermales bacterium]